MKQSFTTDKDAMALPLDMPTTGLNWYLKVVQQCMGLGWMWLAASMEVGSGFVTASLPLRCSFVAPSLPLRCSFVAPSLLLRCSFAAASMVVRSTFAQASLSFARLRSNRFWSEQAALPQPKSSEHTANLLPSSHAVGSKPYPAGILPLPKQERWTNDLSAVEYGFVSTPLPLKPRSMDPAEEVFHQIMAKINSLLGRIRGTMGNMTFAHRNGSNSTYAKEKVLYNKSRTVAQMKQRVRWSNVSRSYRAFHKLLSHAYEDGVGREYNQFMHANAKVGGVYLTKDDSDKGAQLVTNFVVSRGGLQSIEVKLDENHVACSNIRIGQLTIDENTLYTDFCVNVERNNTDIKDGDYISIFYAEQCYNEDQLVPVIRVHQQQLKMDMVCEQCPNVKLWSIVDPQYVKAIDGMWGVGFAVNGGITFVHSSRTKDGVRTSTQALKVWNPILADYCTKNALTKAINSYGGASDSIYLAPNEEDWEEKLANIEEGTMQETPGSSTPTEYTISASASPAAGGTVSGAGRYASGTSATLTATANAGYTFSRWSDGETQSQRTVMVRSSGSYTAIFISNGGGSGGSTDEEE